MQVVVEGLAEDGERQDRSLEEVMVGALGSCFMTNLEPPPHPHPDPRVWWLTAIWTSANLTFKMTSRCSVHGMFFHFKLLQSIKCFVVQNSG